MIYGDRHGAFSRSTWGGSREQSEHCLGTEYLCGLWSRRSRHNHRGTRPNVDWTVNGRSSDYPMFGNWKTPAKVQEFFRGVDQYEKFTDFSPRDYYAVDERVFVLGHYAGSIKNTGKPFASDWIHIFTIRNGKVVEFREFNDTHQFVAAYRG